MPRRIGLARTRRRQPLSRSRVLSSHTTGREGVVVGPVWFGRNRTFMNGDPERRVPDTIPKEV